MTDRIEALIAQERLPASYIDTVDRWWRPLGERIAQWRMMAGHTLVVGINGAQGSGKSTLCRFLADVLLPERGLSVATVSLDDFYLRLADRHHMARDTHPLFRTRGVPGTHDVALGIAVLDDLVAGRDVLLPRFSKALDDRLPQSEWMLQSGPVDVVLFEGWCVGARPQGADSLTAPQNRLEAEDDPDGVWRQHVNRALGSSYAQWFSRIDRLVMLKPPSFDAVLRNRLLQEHKLRLTSQDAPGVMDDDAVRRFVSHYERLTRHMFADLPPHADMLFDLDAAQAIVASHVNAIDAK
ncbi:kinase [Sphingobium sp. HWE2-09]|uniref:kinase n=1 Tax=Sphingobium sp. HWE2-09 TaxID=3108390 RepID=UPI002DC7F8E1|nr:kinase [Sphingobium sp. HWE2-09]